VHRVEKFKKEVRTSTAWLRVKSCVHLLISMQVCYEQCVY